MRSSHIDGAKLAQQAWHDDWYQENALKQLLNDLEKFLRVLFTRSVGGLSWFCGGPIIVYTT